LSGWVRLTQGGDRGHWPWREAGLINIYITIIIIVLIIIITTITTLPAMIVRAGED
jgi:hypothetical protein